MIELNNINKKFNNKVILNNFFLKVKENEFVTIIGKSGSGKTTILNIIGLLEKADSGNITINNYTNPNKKEVKLLRRYSLGYIFQNYGLLEDETVKSNLELAKKFKKDFNKTDFNNVLKEVGLSEDILHKKVYNLSGGEQQRLAIARILLKPCTIILADEPTGNLDDYNKKIIINLLKNLNKTIICVTHDDYVAKNSDRVISLD
ncbi:ATP-binding cassette domain-containing protein [Clostridium sporogenes]|uniref:ATP-binding cassette domain-containing protein n=1 Tax=Clostridium sporogenes TaxID=1509 RepID=UPI003F8DB177